MILLLLVRDEGSGSRDEEARVNDILKVVEDVDEAGLGVNDKKSYLPVKMDDPPNPGPAFASYVESDWKVTQDTTTNAILRKRARFVEWRSKFTAEEIAIIEDGTQQLPDGDLVSGGRVVAGVVYDKFTRDDIIRK